MKFPKIFPSAVLMGAVSLSVVGASRSSAQLPAQGMKVATPVKTNALVPSNTVGTTSAPVTTNAVGTTNDSGTSTTATTDPVGFITLNVAGTHSNVASAISFLAQGMTPAVEYQSLSTSTSANTVTDSKASWTDDQFNTVTSGGTVTGYAYYLEVVSGSGAGLTADIVATNGATTSHSGTPDTLTLSADLSAYLTAGASYKIRKNWTISGIFGTDPTASGGSGLSGGTVSTADQVLLYASATYNSSGTQVTPATYTTYYYQTAGLGGRGWRSTASNSADASGAKIEPGSGVLVQRYQASDLSFPLTGAVKTGTTDTAIQTGLNIVSNPYPVSTITLGTSGLYNPTDPAGNTLAGGTVSTADRVLIYTPATYNGSTLVSAAAYNTYYYQSAGLGGKGWRSTSSNSADASGTLIPQGQSILIQRSNKTVAADGSFEWVISQPF